MRKSPSRKRRRRKYRELAAPMASMIDVVFLLLIFFVYTYKKNPFEAYMSLSLPGPALDSAEVTKAPLTIGVYPGKYTLEGHAFKISEIKSRLYEQCMLSPDYSVMIRMHPDATEGQLISVLDMCYQLKLSDLSVQTLKK